jgi:hypothetical protein
MQERESISTKNLAELYGNSPIPWSRPLAQLEAFVAGSGTSVWLATAGRDGRPHLAGIGAVWLDDRFWIVSGPGTRKSRDLAANPGCSLSLSLPDIDLVVEGTARRVTDDATLERVVKRFNEQGWPASVKDAAFTAEYSAPSAGPPPWYLYEITPTVAFGVTTGEPYGATRWRFGA